MKQVSLILLILCLGLGPAVLAQTSLFNGKDLKGWTPYGTEKWYVEDGLLICESGPDKAYGYLATDKHYKNFELNLEFKQEADGNSGVFNLQYWHKRVCLMGRTLMVGRLMALKNGMLKMDC